MSAQLTDSSSPQSFLGKLKESGPAWLGAGINFGGATVTNAVVLVAASGFIFGWVFFFAIFAIWVSLLACVQISLVTGRNMIDAMRVHVHPTVGWINAVAVMIVNLVFHTAMVTLGGTVLNTLIPLSARFWAVAMVLMAAGAIFLLRPGQIRPLEKLIQYMVYFMALVYLLSLLVVPVDWGAFVRGLFSFSIPRGSQDVLLFTAVLGSSLSLNVVAIQSYATVSRGWGPGQWNVFRFETTVANLVLLFIQFALVAVVGSTLFRAGIQPTNAVEAGLALRPLAGEFSTLLFGLGLFGAIISSVVAQMAVAGYLLCDLMKWKIEPGSGRFKVGQAGLLLVGLSVPLFEWNPFAYVAWGAAFNSTLFPIGLITWWYMVNRQEIMGKHRAGIWMNTGMALAFLVAMTTAIRFWYVTLALG